MSAVKLMFTLAALFVFVYGGLVVLEQVTSTNIGSLSYFWETQENTTLITASNVCQNFTLQRMSETQNPYLNITFAGGNNSDRVYVNSNLIGNLSVPSPTVISFDPTYLEVDTCVTYVFLNDSNTNVTGGNLTYYRYDGCEFGEQACNSIQVTSEITGIFWMVLSFLPLGLVFLLLLNVFR